MSSSNNINIPMSLPLPTNFTSSGKRKYEDFYQGSEEYHHDNHDEGAPHAPMIGGMTPLCCQEARRYKEENRHKRMRLVGAFQECNKSQQHLSNATTILASALLQTIAEEDTITTTTTTSSNTNTNTTSNVGVSSFYPIKLPSPNGFLTMHSPDMVLDYLRFWDNYNDECEASDVVLLPALPGELIQRILSHPSLYPKGKDSGSKLSELRKRLEAHRDLSEDNDDDI